MTSKVHGILGGGLSGVIIANLLHGNKIPFLMVDKGRKAGGRFASRRPCFNYGVPSFVISRGTFEKSEGIRMVMHEWHKECKAKCYFLEDHVHVYAPQMRALASHLEKNVATNVHVGDEVKEIERNKSKQWILRYNKRHEPSKNTATDLNAKADVKKEFASSEKANKLSFAGEYVCDELISTIPIPQLDNLLKGVAYHSQFALMVLNDHTMPTHLQGS
ncbi:amine oxidase, flavin-containing [Reticulomyxa filosa]|uniref:Amine oxidase, flavin-containing n=1 Tax=Reticulomyxa filosa TaxID=46433 RepID=X6MXE1_RETFI|nr:amine oxidase, flavin-containing [Reticulomyxa filosa]|eukprot:ETO18695.1 amine oxidase, flavin-containing [Reticulomyxa filosa]